MAYATIADAEEIYPPDYVLASFDQDGDGANDTARVNAVFEAATATINSYLVGRVDLPLAEVPPDLKLHCIDIAIYMLCPDALRMTEAKRTRYEDAMQALKDYRSGKRRLTTGSSSAPVIEASNNVTTPQITHNKYDEPSVLASTGTRELTRDKLSGLL